MKVSQLQIMVQNARAFQDISIETVKVYKNLGDEESLQHNSLLVVIATNLMFSIELRFKAALLFATGKFEKGHKVYDLYLKLPEHVQTGISTLYDNIRSIAPAEAEPWALFTTMDEKRPSRKVLEDYNPDLTSMLKAHDEGFIKWRYSYEIKQNPILIFDYYNLLMLSSAIEMTMANEMRKFLKSNEK